MFKRIKYISQFAKPFTEEDIDNLVAHAAQNNARHDITGVLTTSGDLFFQIIEGPADKVDALLAKIMGDDRHTHVMVLRETSSASERLFPDWAMKKVDLSSDAAARLEPVSAILEAIVKQYGMINDLTAALERAMWRETSSSD